MSIGFYARRPMVLPHRPYPDATLRVIERAIAEAWRIIRDEPAAGFMLDSADEDRITLELRNCLLDRVLAEGVVPGFTEELFVVSRESKYPSYDGCNRDLMPDLHIRIKRTRQPSLPSADGLFVECKPVDRAHPVGTAYCKKGVLRFVAGQYAWAMSQGMMVGYAAPGYALHEKLSAALRTQRRTTKLSGDVKPCRRCVAVQYAQQSHFTVHRRGFTYPATGTKAPEITLRHIWFNRP